MLRRALLQIHLYVGLVIGLLGIYAGLFMFVMAITGVMIAFEEVTDPLVRKLDTAPASKIPTSRPMSGGPAISLDNALRIATEALPGAVNTNINTPDKPTTVFRVLKKFPEDRTPAGRSRVYIDQFSGKVLLIENTRTAEPGTRILNLKRSAHTGDIFGAPTRAIYFVASLMLAGQVLTGVLIWFGRRRKRRGLTIMVARRSRNQP